MIQNQVRIFSLLVLSSLLLNASHILKNDILKIAVVKQVNIMGDELSSKTGVNTFVIATNEKFPVGFNLVEYSKKYENNISKPFVILIFAPQALITSSNINIKGRVGIIPSSEDIKKLYDYSSVQNATIDVVAVKDSNSIEDKYNIGVLQGFSELADNIAYSKDIKLTTTIPNETQIIVWILRILIFTGSILVFWIFAIRPFFKKSKS